MMFNVPQFIDVEDKIAGPLTVKQLLWMVGMTAAVLVVVSMFPTTAAFIISVPIVVAFVLLAFYRPNGQPLISYVTHAFFFLFRPKVLVWKRPAVHISGPVVKTVARQASVRPKVVTQDEIRRVADIMDRR